MHSVETILAALVAQPSICGTPNGAIVSWVRDYLAGHGVACAVLPGPEGDRTNLFATIGPQVEGGLVLSAHLDVVPAPAEGWGGDPFTLRSDGEKLIGRGAVDMKGFVACMLASVPALLALDLARPVHLALSYDEELGCIGVRHLLTRLPELCPPAFGCVVGEPTGLRPVLRHKGKVAQRITVEGKAGHSSRPDLADNAIHAAGELVVAIRDAARKHASAGPFAPAFEPPYSTLQVGTIGGGTGINIVPARCVMEVEARAIAGTDPEQLLAFLSPACDRIAAEAAAEGRALAFHIDTISAYPALALEEAHPLAALAEAASGEPRQAAVSFGTEAGLFQEAGVPAIVCGPGDVNRAHKPEEYITRAELAGAMTMIGRLVASLT